MKKYLFILISVSCFAQFNPVQWYDFGHGNYEPNTFIGGVGGTINTPALLAARLGINAGRIKKFQVVGSDVSCHIIGTYSLSSHAFSSDTNITSFEDHGQCVAMGTRYNFRYCTNLTKIIMPGLATILYDAIYYNVNLTELNFQNLTTVSNLSISRSNNMNIYIPKVTNLGSTTGQDGIFYNDAGSSNVTIYANLYLQTCNGGAPDGDLLFAISQGNSVIYVP